VDPTKSRPRPATLAQLGVLCQLEVKRTGGWKWGELDFVGKDVQVAANPTGNADLFIGGDQKSRAGN